MKFATNCAVIALHCLGASKALAQVPSGLRRLKSVTPSPCCIVPKA